MMLKTKLRKRWPGVEFGVTIIGGTLLVNIMKSPFFEGIKNMSLTEQKTERGFYGAELDFLQSVYDICGRGENLKVRIGSPQKPHICTDSKDIHIGLDSEKTQLVIVDRDTIGYITPGQLNNVFILKTISPYRPQFGVISIHNGLNIRLAGEKDFDLIGVSFVGYKADPDYLHADNCQAENNFG